MSRSWNETSVPVQRGRRGMERDKRLSSKRVRRMNDIDPRTERILKRKLVLNK